MLDLKSMDQVNPLSSHYSLLQHQTNVPWDSLTDHKTFCKALPHKLTEEINRISAPLINEYLQV